MSPKSRLAPFAKASLLLLLLATLLSATALAQLPSPEGFVNDYAGVLPQASELESLAASIEEETGAEIAIVTIQSLPDGYDTPKYAVELFEQWGIGKREQDNGLLILLVVEEKHWRIEVGYGLEPIINDAKAGRIGRAYLEPALESGDYSTIEPAVLEIYQEIKSSQDSGLLPAFVTQIDPIYWAIIIVIIIVAIIVLALTGNIWIVYIIVRILLFILTRGRSGFGGGSSGGGGAGNIYMPGSARSNIA